MSGMTVIAWHHVNHALDRAETAVSMETYGDRKDVVDSYAGRMFTEVARLESACDAEDVECALIQARLVTAYAEALEQVKMLRAEDFNAGDTTTTTEKE